MEPTPGRRRPLIPRPANGAKSRGQGDASDGSEGDEDAHRKSPGKESTRKPR
eukprot:CAMPEP_0170310378 /NCGR_PEP_ID=MMETSP0116_2-20130129/55673_1 /TAXON_ID=400756 /ORGANISM="Durinskia baltica, Strain CSIRO CS-38" /LENGTH=51 /DNA_ID=CAMNT_0010562649 /DNA_START=17 /DNA_END=169 /DNA_ORIENTATION=+